MAKSQINFGELGGGVGLFDLIPIVTSTYQSFSMANMFDNDDSTRWVSDGSTGAITIYNFNQRAIKKLSIRVGDSANPTSSLTIEVYGSNTSATDKTNPLYSQSLNYNSGLTDILNATTNYKYYIIDVLGTNNYYGSVTTLKAT